MALNETAKHFYEKEIERLLELGDKNIIKEKFLDMRSQIDDLYVELGERARRIVELEKESERPTTGGVDRVFAFGKEMDIRELFDELLKANKRIAELEIEVALDNDLLKAVKELRNIEKLKNTPFVEYVLEEEPLPFTDDECDEKTKIELPTMPVDVASMLINEKKYQSKYSSSDELDLKFEVLSNKRYSKNDLREIAEHLLAYCNNSDEDEDDTQS